MKKQTLKNILLLSALAINIPPLKLLLIFAILKFKITTIDMFYLSFLVIAFVNIFIKYFTENIELNYLLLFLFSTFIFLLAFILSKATRAFSKNITYHHLWIFYLINYLLLIVSFVFMIIQYKTFMIFDAGGGTVGDSFKGLYQNSHILMIVFSFYSILFLSRQEYKKFLSAFVGIMLSSFMSGFLVYLIVFLIMLPFLNKNKNILYIYFFFLIGMFLFILLNMENINYAINIISSVFDTNPPRKIISFTQTYESFTSDFKKFLFGAGVGEFSSRMAFVAGGEYVTWYPSFLIYKSELFEANHFRLWNNEILSNPFNDGTANQPFSFYNQLFGEYGFLGVLSFIGLYLMPMFRQAKLNKFKLLILFLMLGYFIFDYWFEYLSVVLFFELFMFIPNSVYKK